MQNSIRRIWFLAVNERLGYAALLNTERKPDFEPKPGLPVPMEITGNMGRGDEKIVVARVYGYSYDKNRAPGWGIEAIDGLDRIFEAMGVIGFNQRPQLIDIVEELVRGAFDAGVEWSVNAPADHHKKRRAAPSSAREA